MFRAAPYSMVFDGQSLNLIPGAATYPSQMMDGFEIDGAPPSWSNVAEGGASWTVLGSGGVGVVPAAQRLFPHLHQGLTTFLILCGGTSDVLENDSGAQIYADMETYVNAAKAVNAGLVVVAQTITPCTIFTGPQNTALANANTAILADANGVFDATVNVALDPLDDAADTTYYADGTHWTAAGAAIAAERTLTAVESLL